MASSIFSDRKVMKGDIEEKIFTMLMDHYKDEMYQVLNSLACIYVVAAACWCHDIPEDEAMRDFDKAAASLRLDFIEQLRRLEEFERPTEVQ